MDLQLSSNYKDIQVLHWILDLTCHFSKKQLSGSSFLFCQTKNFPNKAEQQHHNLSSISVNSQDILASIEKSDESFDRPFVLDCQELDIEACYFYSLQDFNLGLMPFFHHSSATDNLQSQNDSLKANTNVKMKVDAALVDKYLRIFRMLKCEDNKKPVSFFVEKACLKMSIPGIFIHGGQGLKYFAIQIIYRTLEKGASLTWTIDQDMRPCVYTSGHLLNNRTLMPCQDMPQAMSTWHCFISVPDDNANSLELDNVTVLMAGETEPSIYIDQDGARTFSYHSSYPMPASTFALAIGIWPQYQHLKNADNKERSQNVSLDPKVRIFAPSKFHGNALKSLVAYLPSCFRALSVIIGKYPLQRLDILIVPYSFDSLGMMCPHLMFLSQSILVQENKEAEGGMFYRVAHELCHTWLGILSGPKDWTEEWLTEGICCYLEDVVHATACQWSNTEATERLELRCLLKHRNLKAEISTTSETLQTLRPNAKSDTPKTTLIPSIPAHDEPLIIKNGLNPEKTLLQVHYLKGFFLLKHLEQLSGKDEFRHALKIFVLNHLGQLFSSMDLLVFFFDTLPKLRQSDLTVSCVCQEWLDSPGMPQAISDFALSNGNTLYSEVLKLFSVLKDGSCRKRSKYQADTSQGFVFKSSSGNKGLLPEQRILLLDLLVEDDVKLTRQQMADLRSFLKVQESTAEVQHSWCELVTLRKSLFWLEDVEKFLFEHQAMGVYLYGELMISENSRMQALARKVFQSVREDMAEGQRLAVEEMLHPT